MWCRSGMSVLGEASVGVGGRVDVGTPDGVVDIVATGNVYSKDPSLQMFLFVVNSEFIVVDQNRALVRDSHGSVPLSQPPLLSRTWHIGSHSQFLRAIMWSSFRDRNHAKCWLRVVLLTIELKFRVHTRRSLYRTLKI